MPDSRHGLASSGDWRPFPSTVVAAAHETYAKWPGGVRVLQAAEYLLLGTLVDAEFDNFTESMSFLRYTIDQDEGGSGGRPTAPNVIRFSPQDIELDVDADGNGLAGGTPARLYHLWIRLRCNTAGIENQNVWIAAGNDDQPLWDTSALTVTAGDLSTDEGYGLYGPWLVAAREGFPIDIRIWRNGEADAEIEIDQILLFPQEDVASGIGTGRIEAGLFLSPGDQWKSAGATYPAGSARYSGNPVSDTQALAHPMDGGLVWSAYVGAHFYDHKNGTTATRNRERGFLENPQHVYLAARLDFGANPDEMRSAAGFMTFGQNGMAVATVMVRSSGWSFYYLALVPIFYNDYEVAGWIPNIAGDSPFNQEDAPADGVLIGQGYACSSLIDQAAVVAVTPRTYVPAPAQPGGVDSPAQGVVFAFDDDTHGMAQTWTRVDDPAA